MLNRLAGVGISSVDRGRWSERAAIVACAVLVAAIIWLFVRMFWTVVGASDDISVRADAPLQVSNQSNTVSVSKWHLFGAPIQSAGVQRVASATTLALSLRGTLADGDPRRGIAVIADEQGVERAWRVGETLRPGVSLDEVYSDRVVLLHDGVPESLPLARDEAPLERVAPIPADARGGNTLRNTAPAAPPATALFTPPQLAHGSMDWQKTMDDIASGRSNLANNLRVEPVVDNGKVAGVRVSAVGAQAALMTQFGLRPSDIITAVNGTPVDSVARGQQILESLGNAQSVRVTVTRDGMPTDITINLR
jgi:general secretion pathway protein C